MGIKCTSPEGIFVIKARWHFQLGTLRNALKEGVVGCQASLLPKYNVADTFVSMHNFLWCDGANVAPFLKAIDVRCLHVISLLLACVAETRSNHGFRLIKTLYGDRAEKREIIWDFGLG